MIVPDINILIYAINKDFQRHALAKKWLETVISGEEPVGLSWIVILGFLRIITNEKIMSNPVGMEVAFGLVDEWMSFPSVQIIGPTDQHWKIFRELLTPLSTAGNMTSDAHLAALTIEHSGSLYSTDNDFSRFKGLRWKNPLDVK